MFISDDHGEVRLVLAFGISAGDGKWLSTGVDRNAISSLCGSSPSSSRYSSPSELAFQ